MHRSLPDGSTGEGRSFRQIWSSKADPGRVVTGPFVAVLTATGRGAVAVVRVWAIGQWKSPTARSGPMAASADRFATRPAPASVGLARAWATRSLRS